MPGLQRGVLRHHVEGPLALSIHLHGHGLLAGGCRGWKAVGLILQPALQLDSVCSLGPTRQMLSHEIQESGEIQAILVSPWLSLCWQTWSWAAFSCSNIPCWLPVWGSLEVLLVASWSPDRCSVVYSQNQQFPWLPPDSPPS